MKKGCKIKENAHAYKRAEIITLAKQNREADEVM